MVKLKRKLMFHGHVYFEPVHPDIVFKYCNADITNNSLYNDISIDLNQIPENLIYLTDMLDDREIDIVLESHVDLEENDNPLNTHRFSVILRHSLGLIVARG